MYFIYILEFLNEQRLTVREAAVEKDRRAQW